MCKVLSLYEFREFVLTGLGIDFPIKSGPGYFRGFVVLGATTK